MLGGWRTRVIVSLLARRKSAWGDGEFASTGRQNAALKKRTQFCGKWYVC